MDYYSYIDTKGVIFLPLKTPTHRCDLFHIHYKKTQLFICYLSKNIKQLRFLKQYTVYSLFLIHHSLVKPYNDSDPKELFLIQKK